MADDELEEIFPGCKVRREQPGPEGRWAVGVVTDDHQVEWWAPGVQWPRTPQRVPESDLIRLPDDYPLPWQLGPGAEVQDPVTGQTGVVKEVYWGQAQVCPVRVEFGEVEDWYEPVDLVVITPAAPPARRHLTNRAEIEAALIDYWTSQVNEVKHQFLTRFGPDVSRSLSSPAFQERITRLIRNGDDENLARMANPGHWTFPPGWPEPAWSDAPIGTSPPTPPGREKDKQGEIVATTIRLAKDWLGKTEPPAQAEPEPAEPPRRPPGADHAASLYCELDRIRVVGNIRRRFDETKLAELAESIRSYGVLEPLLVRPRDGRPTTFDLIAGERRYRAAKLAGFDMVPVRVLNIDAKGAAELQLLENLQRQDLDPIEEAQGFRALLAHGHTQEQLAAKLGCSQAHISNRLRLLRLPPEIQDSISHEIVPASTALALLKWLPEGIKPPSAVTQAVAVMVKEPPPSARAAEWLEQQIRQGSRSMRNTEYGTLFQWERECVGVNCPHLAEGAAAEAECPYMAAWWNDRYCMHTACHDKKQKHFKAERDRQAEEARRKPIEQKAAAKGKTVAEVEAELTAERERQKQQREATKAKAVEQATAEPAPPLPSSQRLLVTSVRLRDVAMSHHRNHSRGAVDLDRECLLPLEQLLDHWQRRLQIGASQMPGQMDKPEVVIPEQQIRINGAPYGGNRDAEITKKAGLVVTTSGGQVTDEWPDHPVYYRCVICRPDGGAQRMLTQTVVIACPGRHLVLTQTSGTTMRQELYPQWLALVAGLPAYPPELMEPQPATAAAGQAAD